MNFSRFTFTLIFLLGALALSGCSYSKETLINHSKSREYGYYAVEAVVKDEEQAKNLDYGLYGLSEESLDKLYEPLSWTWDRGKWNYTKAYDLKKYPTYLVFDNEGLVLKTTNLNEVDNYLSQK